MLKPTPVMYAASAQSIYISINKSTLHVSKVWLRTDCINKNTAGKFNKKKNKKP